MLGNLNTNPHLEYSHPCPIYLSGSCLNNYSLWEAPFNVTSTQKSQSKLMVYFLILFCLPLLLILPILFILQSPKLGIFPTKLQSPIFFYSKYAKSYVYWTVASPSEKHLNLKISNKLTGNLWYYITLNWLPAKKKNYC